MNFGQDDQAPHLENVRKFGRREEPEVVRKLRLFKRDQDDSFNAAQARSPVEKVFGFVFIFLLSFWAYRVSLNHTPNALNTTALPFLLLISGIIATWKWAVFRFCRTIAYYRILMGISQTKNGLSCVIITSVAIIAALGYSFYQGYQNEMRHIQQDQDRVKPQQNLIRGN